MKPPSRAQAVDRPPRKTIVAALVRVLASLGFAGVLVVAPGWAAAATAADSVRADQWHLETLRANLAWRVSTGAGVIVAVIDSGVAKNHPDLSGQVLPGIDLVNPAGGDGTNDAVGHGTTVAALIAGRGDDADGVMGLAPGAKILPVRVLDERNKYNDSKMVAQGIVWAVDHGARVINLSLGSSVVSPSLAEAIDYAFARDVVVVACVGNVIPGETASVWHPASEPGVLAVTALKRSGEVWKNSLGGPQTVLAAPGADMVGPWLDTYQRVQGTSFASPLVAAAAALIRSKSPSMTAANVIQRLIATARDAGPEGRDDRFGFGGLDPYAALTADVSEVLTNPLDTAPPPGKSGFGSATNASPLAEEALVPSVSPTPALGPIPDSDKPIGLAVGLAGFAALVGGGLTLVRKL